MNKIERLFIAGIMLLSFGCSQPKMHLTSYVNPFIGTTVLTDSAELGYVPPWRTWNGLLGQQLPCHSPWYRLFRSRPMQWQRLRV